MMRKPALDGPFRIGLPLTDIVAKRTMLELLRYSTNNT